ncbi:GRRM system radical SAM/SPASM domain protein [Bacillus pseudomycoides]|nr:hypothetical protein bpmyx0001_11230 [Bacillus pseudomycoides DSM 12442]OOR53976.1 GRRM system radical SAM/SPASM domain protein [Bacillus pseudomycoides]PDY13051.1 GRRM system radical SAM/SPASM domain protein [Bacillus pseudomycoides]PEU44370.1 GRRM system radical SAM/SPASM domain protein [Bacillus pseudomycoides]PFY17887.1 GRRM system radical SAM/SPASM domain protein [Bacillus pseudomycoides]
MGKFYMTVNLIVIQPSSLCNLNCSYCYVPERQNSMIIEDSTLENIFSKTLSSTIVSDHIEYLWHAGEPLTVGISFYEKIIDYIKKYNIENRKVINSVQTNGTLLSAKWCEFFKENHFKIGISMDGPEFLHNQNRKDWSGKGSHHIAMRGVNLLKEYGLDFGAICVLTKESLHYPEEIFYFFYENDFKWVGFNVEEIENSNHSTSLNSGKLENITRMYNSFMSRLFDLWQQHRDKITIREFQNMCSAINIKLKDRHFYCVPDEIQKLRIVTIQKNGSITTNSPEFAGSSNKELNNFIVGNINSLDSFEHIINNDIYLKLQVEIENGVKNCADTCLYFDLCGGGSPSNKYFENGSISSTETITCILHKQILASVVINKLSE